MYEYLEELDEMNWSARGNVLKQYLSNTSIGTTVNVKWLFKTTKLTKTQNSPQNAKNGTLPTII
jgi:hypothetical protein